MSEEIPLFPLGTVMFPGGPLALRIFEARYIDLVRRCMRDSSGFGIVLIREGQEAGGPAVTYDVGTLARIVDFSQQPDGLLGIRAMGERRFRILERRRARDGLNLADVTVRYLHAEGCYEASASHFHPGVWYSTEWSTTDYRTGEQEERNYHLVGFTEEQEREVFEKFKQR